jgi:hypothetical protein
MGSALNGSQRLDTELFSLSAIFVWLRRLP